MATNILGQTLLNQFRVDQFIASGGMGAVYRVYDLKRSVNLAMKVLHADLAEDSLFVRRFQREAEALQSLAHPHIVPFYGLYQAEDFAFLLEAYIDGQTLKEMIEKRRGQPFSLMEALTILKAVCAALGYAHVNQVIHRDVKPANIMLDRGGNIYLTDFGIAQNLSSTTSLSYAGTPAYMAPEQIRGEKPSAATDVYAVGAMFFEMLTGRRPFLGNEQGTETAGESTTQRIFFAHLHAPIPDPCSLNPSLPPVLRGVIAKALEKEPSQRFSGTQEFFNTCLEALDLTPGEVPDRWQDLARSAAIAPLASTILEQAPVRQVRREPQPQQQPVTPPYTSPPADRSPTNGQVSASGQKPGAAQAPAAWREEPPPGRQPRAERKRSWTWLFLLLGLVVVVACLVGGYNVYRALYQPSTQIENQVTDLVGQVQEALQATATLAAEVVEPPPTEPVVVVESSPTPEVITQGEVAVGGVVASGSEATPTPDDPRQPPDTYYPLASCAYSRLHPGDWTYVKYGVDGLFLRNSADVHVSDNIITTIQDGELVLILGNPTCSYKWLMWEAQTSNGQSGWVSESDGEDFWLEPFPTWNACQGAAPSYIVIGEDAMVAPYPPDANRLRAEPSKNAERTGTIQPGEQVRVFDGPQCSDGTTWWLVQSNSSGAQGWTAEAGGSEHWLLPIPRP
jgi:serine/threonine protein kinase